MSDQKAFAFHDPNAEKKQETEISELTFKFSQVSAEERLASFQILRAPLGSRTQAETQAKRRFEALEIQKKQRYDAVSKARQLALGSTENDSSDEEEEEEDTSGKRMRDSDEEMPDYHSKYIKNVHKKKNKKKNKRKNIHADQIMYAEYLESIPDDFMEEWIMMICPKGKRCMVTSGNGETVARSRGGHVIGRFQSILPNGSKSNRYSDYCILDCVYDAVHWTFYVLDIMCWNSYPIFDCDTTFRHFWLQTKIQPNELDAPTNENRFYKIVPVTPIATTETKAVCSDPEAYLKALGYTYDIDGLLFYHRQAHYNGGATPLVGWVPRDDVASIQSIF